MGLATLKMSVRRPYTTAISGHDRIYCTEDITAFSAMIVLVLALSNPASASGVGPAGVAVVDTRYVLVADKLQNSVLLIDYLFGEVVGRRELNHSVDQPYNRRNPQTWPDLVGVATCGSCPFAWVSANLGAKLYRLEFERPLAAAVSTADAGGLLVRALLIDCSSSFSDWHSKSYVREYKSIPMLRMMEIDLEGNIGYLTRHDGEHLLYRFEPRLRCPKLTPILSRQYDCSDLTSVHIWPGISGRLVLTGENCGVLVAQVRPTRQVKIEYRLSLPKGPGRLRDVVVDSKAERLLAMSGRGSLWEIPFSVLGKYPNARHTWLGGQLAQGIARLRQESVKQAGWKLIAGDGKHTGWLDGIGKSSVFTRPHAMVVLPPPHRALLLTDIDNRALRTISLGLDKHVETTTVFYTTGTYAVPPDEPSVENASFLHLHPPGVVDLHKFGISEGAVASWDAAAAHCATRGRKLCSPFELFQELSSGLNGSRFWTNVSCTSCWISSQIFFNEDVSSQRCTDKKTRKIWDSARTDETPKQLPVTRSFSQRLTGWSSGHAAVEVTQYPLGTELESPQWRQSVLRALCTRDSTVLPFICCG